MFEITQEQLSEWLNKCEIQAFSPNMLLISKPDSSTIKICESEMQLFMITYPLRYSCMGIEIMIDDSIPKGKAYLLDTKTMITL